MTYHFKRLRTLDFEVLFVLFHCIHAFYDWIELRCLNLSLSLLTLSFHHF